MIDEARRSHPVVVADGARSASATYPGLDEIAAPFAEPLPDPPAGADERSPSPRARSAACAALVTRRGAGAGLSTARDGDLVLAVNELATNSVRHGGGAGVLRVWQDDRRLICEVPTRAGSTTRSPAAPRPAAASPAAAACGCANQLCDLVQLRAFADGGVVRLHTRLGR